MKKKINDEEYFRESLIYRIDKVENNNQLLKIISDDLQNKQFVTDQFFENIVLREEKFPTGLPGKVNIAIPHTNPEYVNEKFIAVVLLQEPVTFIQMATKSKPLDVSLVFVLGYQNGKNQVKLLQALIDEFILGKGVDVLQEIHDDRAMVEWLRENIESKI